MLQIEYFRIKHTIFNQLLSGINSHILYNFTLRTCKSIIRMSGIHSLNLYTYPLNTVTNIDPLGLTVVFNGNEEQKKAMKDAYESVRKTKHGKEMIDKLESSNHTYIFREPRKGMEHTCYDPTEFIFYIEKDSDHSSCQSQGKDKACKMTPTPLSVVIAHEMGHAMGEKDDGPGHMNNVKKYENPVRKEMGIPDRMKY